MLHPVNKKQSVGFIGALAILVVVTWHLMMLLENAELVEIENRALINQIKLLSPIFLFGLGFIKIVVGRGLHNKYLLRLTMIGLCSPVIFLGSVMVRDEFDWKVIGFHFLWPCLAYLMIPILVDSYHLLKRLILTTTLVIGPVFLWHVYQGLSEDALTRFHLYSGRAKIAPGFINPNLFAMELVTIIVGALLFIALYKHFWVRFFWLFVTAWCLVGLYLSASRSALVLFLVFAFCFYTAWKRRWRVMIFAVPLCIILVGWNLSQQEIDFDDIASGRLELWTHYLKDWVEESTLPTILFGDKIESNELSVRYNPLVTELEVNTTRHYTDNTYLNWLLELGLIGAVLFFIPFVITIWIVWRKILHDSNPFLSVFGFAGLCGIMIQSIFITTIPAFSNPSAFLVLVYLIPSLTLAAKGETAPFARKAGIIVQRHVPLDIRGEQLQSH